MTNPTITRNHGILEDCVNLSYNTSGTADSGDTTHTVDTERTEAGDFWNGAYIKYLTGPNAGEEKLITDFDAGTDTITHNAFSSPVAAGHEYVLTDWKQTADGISADISVLHDDFFDIHVASATGNKTIYWEKDINNLSTEIYTKMLIRYKTSSETIKAKVEAIFTVGDQTVLDETASTTWTVVTVDLTDEKTIDKIRIYATSDTGHVYYDFLLVCQDVITFPYVRPGAVQIHFSDPYISTVNPGRVGDIKEYGGEESPTISINGHMVLDGEWESSTILGYDFFMILLARHEEAWQWFTSEVGNYKVVFADFTFSADSEVEALRVYTMILKVYEQSSGDNSLYSGLERMGY